MKFCCKHRGSISIFLAIILLPCLTFTGLMVDYANINLSKAIVESAGELSTNAALADYDTVLKDVYGLFAMSQKAEDPYAALQTNLEQYFSNTLEANGLIGKESEELKSELLGELMSLFADTGEKTNDNFLDVEYENFTAKPAEDSSLANPNILKNQIVEYMKYRGPAEVGLSMLDSLSIFKKMNAQGEVLEKKVKVDEAIGDLGKACSAFYDAIMTYDDAVAKYKEEEKKFIAALPTIKPSLKNANENIIKYLIYTVDVEKMPYLDSGYSLSNNPYNGSVSGDLSSLASQISSVISDGAANNLRGSLLADIPTLAEIVEKNYIGSLEDICNTYRDYMVTVGHMVKLYNKVGGLTFDGEEPTAPEKKEMTDKEYEAAMEVYKEELKAYNDELDDFNEEKSDALEQAGDYLRTVYTSISSKLKTQVEIYSNKVKNAKSSVEDSMSKVTSHLTRLNTLAKDLAVETSFHPTLIFEVGLGGLSVIEYAKIKGEKVIKELENVSEANQKLNTANTQYASESSGNGGKDEFYANMNSEYTKNAAQFKKEDINAIIEQLEAAEKYFSNNSTPTGVLPYLKDYTFYKGVIVDEKANTEKKATNLAKKQVEDKVKADIKAFQKIDGAYCEKLFNQYVNVPEETVINNITNSIYLKQIGEVMNQNGISKTVVPFYIYLVSTYGVKQDKSNKSGDNLKKNVQSINEEGKDEASLSETDISYTDYKNLFADTPSNTKADNLNDFVSVEDGDEKGATSQYANMQSIASTILGGLSTAIENARDNLLVSEYVFQNFSYCTAEKELKLEYKDQWMDHYKTLSNIPINANNNKIYGCEIEYIIFGKQGVSDKFLWFTTKATAGPESNIGVAKQNIFAIRFVFNSLYALTDGTIDKETLPPALAIQAATGGIFPYQLAQVTIKLALALAESTIDLKELMEGGEVPLKKSRKTWKSSIHGMVNEAKEVAVAKVEEITTNAGTAAIGYIQDGIDNVGNFIDDKSDYVIKVLGDLNSSIDSNLNECASAMIKIATDQVEMEFISFFTEGAEYNLETLTNTINDKLDEYIMTQVNAGTDSEVIEYLKSLEPSIQSEIITKLDKNLRDILATVKTETFDYSTVIDSNMYNKLLEDISSFSTLYLEQLQDGIKNFANKISSYLIEDISNLVEVNGEKLVNDASEKLSKKTSEVLNKYFPTKTTNVAGINSTQSSGSDTIFKFSYKDYLRLFLFLKLSTNSDGVTTRIADVIQMNVGKGLKDYSSSKLGRSENIAAHSKGDAFRMNNAYTYVEVSADIKVNALLLSKNIFVRGTGDSNTKEINYWYYPYKTLTGY